MGDLHPNSDEIFTGNARKRLRISTGDATYFCFAPEDVDYSLELNP